MTPCSCGNTEVNKFVTLTKDEEHSDGFPIATIIGLRCCVCGAQHLFKREPQRELELWEDPI